MTYHDRHRPPDDPYRRFAEALKDIIDSAVASALAGAPHGTASDRAFLSVVEAADRLGLGTTTVKAAIREGRLRSVQHGRRRLVPVEAVSEFAGGLGQRAA